MRPLKPREPGSAAEALSEMMEEIGRQHGTDGWSGIKIAADFLGIAPSTLSHLLDPDHPTGELSFRRVAQLTSRFRLKAGARFMAAQLDAKVVALPRSGVAETQVSALLSIAKESTEVVATGWAALADGVMNKAEARELRRQIGEAVEALLELDARLEVGLEVDGLGGRK